MNCLLYALCSHIGVNIALICLLYELCSHIGVNTI